MARKIIALVLIFIGFYLGAHFYIRWKNTVTDDVSKISRLVDCDPNELKALKIKPKGAASEGVYSFARTDSARNGISTAAQMSFSEWNYAAPLKGEADASLMTRFATMFCEIYDPVPTQDDQFTEGAAPVDTITFDLVGGSDPGTHTIFFGKIADDRLNVVKYRRPDGSERVVKIQPKILQLASLKPRDYLNLKVMRMSSDNVMVASVFKGTKEVFSLERQDDGWRILREGKLLGVGSPEATKFVNRLATLRATSVSEEALSPTACDISSTRMRVQMAGVADRQETLYLQYGKTGPVSVCNSAREALFFVHRDLIPYVEIAAESLVAKE